MSRETGHQVDGMVLALVDAANDKQEDVRHRIFASLQTIGTKKPELVLSCCSSYLYKHPKLSTAHKILVLKIMQKVSQEALESISPDLVAEIIKQATDEMIASKELVPDLQGAASGILVALGSKFCHEVMEVLITKFQPGVVPHFFIMQTLANLASANVYGIVPFLKAVLGTLLPLMGMVRHDNMKWVMAFALARFSEAILEYIANIDKAPDPTVKAEVYAIEFAMAYDILFTWLVSKEPKLRMAVIEALGFISHLLPRDKLDEQLPRLIPSIFSLYKRHTELHPITQSLCMTLDAAVKSDSTSLELLLDGVIHTLFPQICMIPDYSQPSTVKNHSEVLRCFCIIVQRYPDAVVHMLTTSLENPSEKSRIGSLTVLRHIVNTADSHIRDKMQLLLNSLKMVALDNNNKVKKVLAHLVVALGHHNYLEHEIGTILLEFLIRQCSLHDEVEVKKTNDIDYVSNESLRATCENILHLLTTTVPGTEKLLWPKLLEYLIPEKYTTAVGTVCKCSAILASKLREEQCSHFEIDYNVFTDVPEPYMLIARCMVLLGHPHDGRHRGPHILRLMKAFSPCLDLNLSPLWDADIPQLLNTIQEGDRNKDFSQAQWENSVLNFLSDSLEEIDQEEWTKKLGEAFAKQIELYVSYPSDKGFLLKCFGVVVKKTCEQQFTTHSLDLIFSSVRHTIPAEREGCAEAFGRAASAHLDNVLIKLNQLTKADTTRKSAGIFSFFLDSKSEPERELSKATLILCLGCVAQFAPIQILGPQVESAILVRILGFFQIAKDVEVRLCWLKAVHLIAKALGPEVVKNPIPFNHRKDLLSNVQSVLLQESNDQASDTRILSIQCVKGLLNLDPPMHGQERDNVLKTCLEAVYPLVLEEGSSVNSDTYIEVVTEHLNQLLEAMMLQEFTPDNLFSLLSNVEPWLHSTSANERSRSLTSVMRLLQCYFDHMTMGDGKPTMFGPLGGILARLIPRCTDNNLPIKQMAVKSIYNTFRIAAIYEGYTRDHVDMQLQQLLDMQERLATDDAEELFSITREIGQIVSTKLPIHQVAPFLHVLFEGLSDSLPSSSSGVCVVFNSVIKARGGELHQQVEVLMKLLHHRLALITCAGTRKSALQVLRTLANHHLLSVVGFLLSSPLPYDSSLVDCWRALAQDPALGSSIVEHLLELTTRLPPFTEHPDPRNSKSIVFLANSQLMAAVLAMKEMFRQAEMEKCAEHLFCRLFAMLLMLCGVFVGVYAPQPASEAHKDKSSWPPLVLLEKKVDKNSPIRMAVEAFQAFLLCAKQEALLQQVVAEGCWIAIESSTKYPEAVMLLARALSEHAPQYLAGTVTFLNPALSSIHSAHRVVGVSFFAELINQRCLGDGALLEMLLNSLVNSLVDSSHTVRKLCIRGLGHVGRVGADQVHKYSTTVLSSMLAGLDDREDPQGDITLEAMSGLSKVLSEIDPSLVSPVLISIVLRIRPCFENARPDIRAASFTLFGDLSRFGTGESQPPFVEQVHNNFVCLLLHLNDEDVAVIQACKYALRLVGPLLDSEAVNTMFQKHLRDDAMLHYGEFMNDLTKLLITDFEDKVPLYVTTNTMYFKSAWSVIQSNAAMFIGFLLGNLPIERHLEIAKQPVCTALILLLKSPSKDVRIKAAEAMSLMHSY